MKPSNIDLNWQETVVILLVLSFIAAYIDPGILDTVADFWVELASYIPNPF